MKTEYMCTARVDDLNRPLFVLRVRTERQYLVTLENLNELYTKVEGELSEHTGRIDEEYWKRCHIEFEQLRMLLNMLSDSPFELRQAQLALDWRPWPGKDLGSMETFMSDALARSSFISITGQSPNYSLNLDFGTTGAGYSVHGDQLDSLRRYLEALTPELLDAAALSVANRTKTPKEAAIAIGVAVGVVAVATGGTVLVAVGVAAVASGAVSTATALGAIGTAAAVVSAASGAYTAYLAGLKAQQEKDEAAEAAARAEKDRAEKKAAGIREIGAGGPAFDGPLSDNIMHA